MTLKQLISKTGTWLHLSRTEDYQPQIDDDGLINTDAESPQPPDGKPATPEPQNNHVLVKKAATDKNQSLEKLQEGFNELVTQLKGINDHLSRQAAQHEELVNRMDKLPELLQSFPAVVENQKQTTEQLFEQLKAVSIKDQQFIDAVEKIPNETVKQTDALVNIDHQLAAAADIDVQMAESFNRFNESIDKLDQTSISQTDSIMQMSRTFATSDRYLKYLVSRQNKRFMWIFMTAIGVCVFAILLLTLIILYLKQ